jgi:hypothetical protein
VLKGVSQQQAGKPCLRTSNPSDINRDYDCGRRNRGGLRARCISQSTRNRVLWHNNCTSDPLFFETPKTRWRESSRFDCTVENFVRDKGTDVNRA